MRAIRLKATTDSLCTTIATWNVANMLMYIVLGYIAECIGIPPMHILIKSLYAHPYKMQNNPDYEPAFAALSLLVRYIRNI